MRKVPDLVFVCLILAFGAPVSSVFAAEFGGTLSANRAVTISTQLTGEVVEVRVHGGQLVRPAEILARLDARLVSANVQAARARAEDLAHQLQRTETLYERGVIADRDLEIARRDFDLADAELRRLQAQLDLTEIRAPFAGRILRRYVNPGETIVSSLKPGRLFSLIPDSKSLAFSIEVPRRPDVRLGGQLPVRVADRQRSAVLTQIQPLPGPDRRQLLVLQVENRDGRLRAGQRAVLVLPDQKQTDEAGKSKPAAEQGDAGK